MNQTRNYTGGCFCGAVEFCLSGEPEAMAYCHCDSCRHWSAGPVNAFTLWKPDSSSISRGADLVGTFDRISAAGNEPGTSQRKWRRRCGGHIYVDHPTMGVVDVLAFLIRDFTFTPAFHVHYQETVHPMQDGLPKFRDLPTAAGGSGEELSE